MNGELAELLSDLFGMPVSEIQPHVQKSDVGAWDSLRQMDLVLSLERKYNINLDIPDILRMTTVAEIVAMLRAKGVSLAD